MGSLTNEITKIQEEVSYRESPRINQSFLKDVIKNVTRSDEDKPTEAMEDGTIVDCLITTPELFYEKYYVTDVTVPDGQFKQAIDKVWSNVELDSMELYQQDLIEAYRSISSNNWKDDTIWNKLLLCKPYWDSLWDAKGRKVISSTDFALYQQVATNLLTGKTSKWLNADGLVETIEFQVPIYFDYELDGEVFECKILLDVVKKNHVNRTIRMIDVKTTGSSTKYWPTLAKKLRADIQASFGTEALKFAYPDWTVLNPVFVVESITYPGKPRDFEATELDLITGKKGCDVMRGFAVTERCVDTDLPCESKEIYRTELGFEDALRILKQSKKFGLSDFDVDYYFHVKNDEAYKLNVFVQ